MASLAKIDIFNMTLALLGEPPASSIDTPSTSTEVIGQLSYNQARREVLRVHPWNFAERTDYLNRSGASSHGYTDAYTLPKELVKILWVGESYYKQDYTIRDNKSGGTEIHLNYSGASVLPIIYTADIHDVTKFDSLFIELLSYKIGTKIAFYITKKHESVKEMNDLYNATLLDAFSIDAQEKPMKRIQTSKILNARKNITGGGSSLDQGGKYIVFE